jgi:hypothetical protein
VLRETSKNQNQKFNIESPGHPPIPAHGKSEKSAEELEKKGDEW